MDMKYKKPRKSKEVVLQEGNNQMDMKYKIPREIKGGGITRR